MTVRYHVDKGPRPRIGSVRVVDTGRTSSSPDPPLAQAARGRLPEAHRRSPTAASGSRTSASTARWTCGPSRGRGTRCATWWWGWCTSPTCSSSTGSATRPQGSSSTPEGAPTAPSDDRIQGAVAVELNNPFGYGVKTRAYTFLTKSRQTWGVSFDAATLVGWRVRTQLFVFDDDADDDFLLAGIESRVRGITLQQSRALLARPAQPALARPAAAAVGLHVQEHRVLRNRAGRGAARGQPRLRHARRDRRRARQPHRPDARGVLDAHQRVRAHQARLRRGLRAALRPALRVRPDRTRRVGAGPARRDRARGRSAVPDREPLPRRRVHDRARLRRRTRSARRRPTAARSAARRSWS